MSSIVATGILAGILVIRCRRRRRVSSCHAVEIKRDPTITKLPAELIFEIEKYLEDDDAYAFSQATPFIHATLAASVHERYTVAQYAGLSPMICACITGNLGQVKYLIREFPEQIEIRSPPEEYDLRYTARGGADQLFMSNGSTPLVWAARYGELQIMRELLEAGADVNNGDESVVAVLFANPSVQRVKVNTALLHAAEAGNLRMVWMLIKHGVDLQNILIDYPYSYSPHSYINYRYIQGFSCVTTPAIVAGMKMHFVTMALLLIHYRPGREWFDDLIIVCSHHIKMIGIALFRSVKFRLLLGVLLLGLMLEVIRRIEGTLDHHHHHVALVSIWTSSIFFAQLIPTTSTRLIFARILAYCSLSMVVLSVGSGGSHPAHRFDQLLLAFGSGWLVGGGVGWGLGSLTMLFLGYYLY